MKKYLFLIIAALLMTACGSDDEPKIEETLNKEAASIAANLNGTFAAQWESVGSIQHEELKFTPYATPQKHDITIPGQYADIDKTVYIFGTVDYTTYYNDHLLEVSHNYLYTVEVPYTGASPRLTVYAHSNDMIYGNSFTYELRNVKASSFEMLTGGEYRIFAK